MNQKKGKVSGHKIKVLLIGTMTLFSLVSCGRQDANRNDIPLVNPEIEAEVTIPETTLYDENGICIVLQNIIETDSGIALVTEAANHSDKHVLMRSTYLGLNNFSMEPNSPIVLNAKTKIPALLQFYSHDLVVAGIDRNIKSVDVAVEVLDEESGLQLGASEIHHIRTNLDGKIPDVDTVAGEGDIILSTDDVTIKAIGFQDPTELAFPYYLYAESKTQQPILLTGDQFTANSAGIQGNFSVLLPAEKRAMIPVNLLKADLSGIEKINKLSFHVSVMDATTWEQVSDDMDVVLEPNWNIPETIPPKPAVTTQAETSSEEVEQ